MGRKGLMLLCSIGVLMALTAFPVAVAQSDETASDNGITRIMMLPPEAEVTGMHVDTNGHFFVNAMHPDPDHYKATVVPRCSTNRFQFEHPRL